MTTEGKQTVLVTGATGMVGRAVVAELKDHAFDVRCTALRARDGVLGVDLSGDLDSLRDTLDTSDAVVHLAARAHVIRDRGPVAPDKYVALNRDSTIRLARASLAGRCRRFLFVSTIKVNGDGLPDHAYTESDVPRPQGPYAQSKWQAEIGLRELTASSGLRVTIVRPPLVYGPGVRGNFRRLWNLVGSGMPLPVSRTENRRSLVNARNLASLIRVCLEREAAAGELFLASDQDDVSTRELITRISRAQSLRPRVFRVPDVAFRAARMYPRLAPAIDRLCGSLAVDSSKATRLLGWRPQARMIAGLREIADAIHASRP